MNLGVNGGEHLTRYVRRWRDWVWGRLRELDVGQRVRIEIGEPEGLDLGAIWEVYSPLHTPKARLREQLADLRRKIKADPYSARAHELTVRDRKRPPPRTYPRAPIRSG